MKNYALDTKMLPKVWVTWASTKNGQFNKRYWLNCQTGKKKTTPESWMLYTDECDINAWGSNNDVETRIGCTWRTENKDKIWVASGSSLNYAYVKYHADIDRLEVAAVGMDTTRKEEPHPWKFLGGRFYIGRDKTIVDQNGNFVTRYNLYQYHTAYSGKELLSMLSRMHISDSFLSEFKKFIGENYFTIGDGSTIAIEHPWHLQQWYITTQKTRSKGKQQQITDELTTIPLSDTTGFSKKYPVIDSDPTSRWSTKLRDVVYFESINDDLSVLRAFVRDWYNDELRESWRMYIRSDGSSRIVAKGNDGWVPSRQIKDGWRRHSYIANIDEAMEKCSRIKYVLGSVDKIPETHKVDFLVTALRFPEIEQLAKFGYQDKCLNVTHSYTPKAELKEMFGGYYNDREKNLLRKVGLTKEQLDHHMSSTEYRASRVLRTMRQMFGNDLSHMDKNSFVKYYKGCEQLCSHFWRGLDFHMERLNIDGMRFFKNICRLAEKRESAWTIANDTMQAYESLNLGTQPAIDWYFNDLSDLTRAHDAVTELKRMQDAERRARWDMEAAERLKKEEEKRIKLDKERKQYEYEDDKYIIRLPKNGPEIVQEGSTQHICIGGYVSRHSTGGTNLFFLREKSAESMPFYAIEMSNDKTIIQIHGFGNKWLGNDPDAIPTVIRWLRKHNIQCSDKILTCKAKGYCSVNEYVPMPVVD